MTSCQAYMIGLSDKKIFFNQNDLNYLKNLNFAFAT